MVNSPPPPLVCRSRVFDFTERSYLMAVLNVTPDSFSDGGRYLDPARAVERGVELAALGADVIDIGGESTRPGAAAVSPGEELARVVPVIRELSKRVDVPISIDTSKAEVARRALDAGAQIVNDVSAMCFDPQMAGVVAGYRVPVVLMHMRGTPLTMQRDTGYSDLIGEVRTFLRQRIEAAEAAGVAPDRIIIDPGLGFGKSIEKDNFTILDRLEALGRLGKAVLVGPSRKAFIGRLLGREVGGREEGTAAAVALAVYNGAQFVRVHDVRAMKMVARVADVVRRAG